MEGLCVRRDVERERKEKWDAVGSNCWRKRLPLFCKCGRIGIFHTTALGSPRTHLNEQTQTNSHPCFTRAAAGFQHMPHHVSALRDLVNELIKTCFSRLICLLEDTKRFINTFGRTQQRSCQRNCNTTTAFDNEFTCLRPNAESKKKNHETRLGDKYTSKSLAQSFSKHQNMYSPLDMNWLGSVLFANKHSPKYLLLCSTKKSHTGLDKTMTMTRGWVNNDHFYFGTNHPFNIWQLQTLVRHDFCIFLYRSDASKA